MDDFNYLEEPPPIHRTVVHPEPRRKTGLLAARPSRPSAPPADRDYGAAAQSSSGKGVLLSLGLVVVVIAQTWLYFGLRGDLAELRTRHEQAQSSLAQLWESAKGLDQDRMVRLALLADSIRSVFDYAQGQIQVWGQRLDENDRNTVMAAQTLNLRLDRFATADQVHRSRVDALERQDRTHSYAFEALSRRAQLQESSMRDVSSSVAWLRESLGRVNSTLAALEQQYAAYGQLGRRVESLSGWADEFRRAGLSGDAVQNQFSALSSELRRIRIRVDSLRTTGRIVTSSDPR
jgi:hypothetical protein